MTSDTAKKTHRDEVIPKADPASRQAGQAGKKTPVQRGGAGSQSGATGVQGKNSPR